MKLCTKEEARHLDHVAMTEYGLPEQVLMENAGADVVRLTSSYVDWKDARVIVVAGTGNNGGDGFVAARYASLAGADAAVLLMGNEEHMSESSRMYAKTAAAMGIPIHAIKKAEEAEPWLSDANIIIDALIGTGLSSEVTGEKKELIERINESAATVISVDVPSGMLTDTGRAAGIVVDADYTVALGSLKRGHILYPGCEYTGLVLYSSIGIPEKAREALPVTLTEAEQVSAALPQRTLISHKGNNGFVGILAGSEGMAGAGLLAAQGAVYAGAGKVALVTVDAPAYELTGLMPEVMVSSLGDAPAFTCDMEEEAKKRAAAWDVLAIGPGLGRSDDTQLFVQDMLQSREGVIVVDADALYAAAAVGISWKKCPGQCILTPHVGEFARLSGLSPKTIEEERIDCAVRYAAENHVVLVLKGAPTVVALPDGRSFVNSTGNPGMAAGGMGDTLTGIIAALAGQGMSAAEAAVAGVYLHGLAGDRLAEKKPVGFTASELAREIPLARASLLACDEA